MRPRKEGKRVGVFLVKRNGVPYRWIVKCTIQKVRTYVGCFDSEEKASEAWEKFAKKKGLGVKDGKRM